jgi:dienelactone hydrolase
MMCRPIIVAIIAALISSFALSQSTPSTPTLPPIEVGDAGPGGIRIDIDGVFANFFPARIKGRRPAVLFLGGSEGGLRAGRTGMIKALGDTGFNVLYVCYFGCPRTPPKLVAVPLETFDRALAFLRAQPAVNPNRIAVVGGSKGGEAALLVGTRDRRVKAVVAGMPSSVVWPGIARSGSVMQSSWTARGMPLPFLPYASGSFKTAGIFGLYNDALPALSQHPDAVIPVEQILARILLICGEADSLWPSCRMTEQILDRLTSKGMPEAIVLRYKDAGHAVLGIPVEKTSPNYEALADFGGTADGNAKARADGWPKIISFLNATLGPSSHGTP